MGVQPTSATPRFSSALTRRASSPASCCTLMAVLRRWSRSSRWPSKASSSDRGVALLMLGAKDQEIPQLEFERRDAILRDGIATLDRLLASSLTTTTANGAIVGSLRNSTSTRTIGRLSPGISEQLNVRVY